MAGLNINSRQKSIHGSNKKNNGSLLLVIFFGFTPFRCFYWLFSSSTVRYTKLFHSNCPRCFPLFHEKTLRGKRFNVDEATRFQSKDAVLALISGRIIFFHRSLYWLAKTHLRQEPMYENLRHSFLVIISQYVQK